MNDDKKFHLESLRGMAALLVAIFHLQVGSVFENAFFYNASLMVDFFFVLSGYVIALNYDGSLGTKAEVLRFQKRRFVRLYPLHILMLVVFLGIEIAKLLMETIVGISASNPAFTTNNAWNFLTNATLTHAIFDRTLSWNYPSWSISAEFVTYAIFAALTFVRTKFGGYRILYYLPMILIGAWAVANVGMLSPEIGIFRCFLSFFFGAALFDLERRTRLVLPPGVGTGLLVAAIAAVYFSNRLESWQMLVFPIIFGALILGLNASAPRDPAKRLLMHPWLIYLGTVSYGIYMIHAAVWWVFKMTLRFVFGMAMAVDAEGKVTVEVGSAFVASIVHLLGLAVIVWLAHLSYRFMESRFTRAYR
jgi:peptidoglycan/LPS O-acetylase OafA/YrhL